MLIFVPQNSEDLLIYKINYEKAFYFLYDARSHHFCLKL